MHRDEVQHKPWMRGKPLAHLLAMMGSGVIADQVNGPDLGGKLGVQILQERDHFLLPLASITPAIEPARASIEGGQEIHRPGAPILMLHTIGQTRHGRQRGVQARPRLQGGLLIHTEHDFVSPQEPCVEVHHLGNSRREQRIMRFQEQSPENVR
jgi:hypothetical protein